MGIMDGFLIKYGSVAIGFLIVGLPVFGPGREEYLKSINYDKTVITKDYFRNLSLFINLAKAVGRFFVSFKDI